MFLNAQKILDAQDRKTKIVYCPEWDGDVLIGTMGAMDRAKIADYILSMEALKNGKKQKDDSEVLTCDSPEGKSESIEEKEQNDTETRVKFTREQHTNLMLSYLAVTILDPETKKPVFNPEQIGLLGQKNPKPLSRLYEAALKLNAETEEEMEEIEKNSVKTAAENSGGD